MKISVDDQELFTLSEVQKKVIKHDIQEDIFEEDMKRRLQYILTHKYARCMDRLRQEWQPKLMAKGINTPKDDDAFAELVFSQSEYRNRAQREFEIQSNRHNRSAEQGVFVSE